MIARQNTAEGEARTASARGGDRTWCRASCETRPLLPRNHLSDVLRCRPDRPVIVWRPGRDWRVALERGLEGRHHLADRAADPALRGIDVGFFLRILD